MAHGSMVGFLAVMVTAITKKLLYLYQLVPFPPMQVISSHSIHSLSTQYLVILFHSSELMAQDRNRNKLLLHTALCNTATRQSTLLPYD